MDFCSGGRSREYKNRAGKTRLPKKLPPGRFRTGWNGHPLYSKAYSFTRQAFETGQTRTLWPDQIAPAEPLAQLIQGVFLVMEHHPTFGFLIGQPDDLRVLA